METTNKGDDRMSQKLVLPNKLEKHREALEKTEREVIIATLAEDKPGITDSKIGGTPYYPEGTEYPLDQEGLPMLLLAQINFSELPKNDKFPKQGLLQFFLPKNDDGFGYVFEDNDHDIKIIFHKEVNVESNQEPPIMWKDMFEDDDEGFYFPVEEEEKLLFTKTTEFINSNVYSFDDEIWNELSEKDDMYEQDNEYDTKLLGYPAFCQQDPREENDGREILLFQLSSETDNVCIGDAGIMNFFISPEDLKKLDFSNVLYNWDCY